MAGQTKPTALKILKGTAQNCRLNKNEPQPELKIPDCPEHLEGEALKEWNRITVILDNLGLLSEMDRTALAAYCQVYGRWVRAEKAVAANGLTVETTHGNIVQNPEVGIANKALELMRKYLVEFGMSPASRPKVSSRKKNKKESMWGEF